MSTASVVSLALNTVKAQEALIDARHAAINTLEEQLRRYALAIEHISEGVCVFGGDQRLIFSNARYAEVYDLKPEDVQPGMTLREIVAQRVVAGTSPMQANEYLALCDATNAGTAPSDWTATLADGRRIQIRHWLVPDGGWISTHEDVTEAHRTVANQRITLQTLIDWVPDNLWVKDALGRFVVANEATARRMGKSVSDLIGKSDLELCPPETARGYFADEERIVATGKPMVDKEEYVLDAEHDKTWLLTTKVPLRNDQDKIIGIVGISRDISDRRRAEMLRSSQAHLLEKIAVGAALEEVLDDLIRLVEMQLPGSAGTVELVDIDGLHLRQTAAPHIPSAFIRAIDGAVVGLQSGPAGAAVSRNEAIVVADTLNDPLVAGLRELILASPYRSCWSLPIASSAGKALGALTLYFEKQRTPTDVELSICLAGCHIAGIAIERKLNEERIRFMATHDVLTGLPNRALLEDRLDQAIRFAERVDHWVTVAFIDLDNFKIINDSLGHNAGDELLKATAQRMTANLRAVDTVVRIGGDEFVILLVDQHKDINAVSATIARIRSAIAAPLQLGGQELRVTASVGVANYPNDGRDAESLLANADAAMYRAKELGRDNYRFYTRELNSKVRGELLLQEALRGALDRHEFVLFYQPQVDMLTRHVFAMEALIRWNHPNQGQILPDRFIPLADQTGLIVPIGDWVLQEACRQNKVWQEAGLPPIKVCVNVSARQFAEKNFVGRVTDALEKSGLAPRYLELELTESLIMQDVEQAVSTMNELQRLGVEIAIDDFGTGYSSLSALKTFPIARLKIDRSFIQGLPSNVDDRAVTTAVISLGKKLNLRIIAEGVENDEQIDFLRKHKCDELQGFRFSKPIPPEDVGAFLKNGGKAS